MLTRSQTRRKFLHQTIGIAALSSSMVHAAEQRSYKAGIIGRTGGGDYGHGFDTLFEGISNVSVEAIADADATGRAKAAARSGAKRQYADFREMLRQEKLDLVSIGPRHPDCHKEMTLAAIAAGAHCIVEKPFTEHLDEADQIVRAARERDVRIAVGHKNRYTPAFARMKRLIEEGFFGEILEMRVQGKQDQRAGGEDLIVLGTHDFDSMRFFFGDPSSCFALVTAKGQPITKRDVRKGREPMLVAGDTVRASFQFPKNIHCSWQSIAAQDGWNVAPGGAERWGFHIFGTKRILAYYSLSEPLFYDSPFLGHNTLRSDWKSLPDPKNWPPPDHELNLARNLVHAVENRHEPLCSAKDGAWTIEMVAAVYESQRIGAPVTFPLRERGNPLLKL